MANTRGASQDALRHVLDTVLALPADDGLRLALQGAQYRKIQSLLSITPPIIQQLTYTVRNPTTGDPETFNLQPVHENLIETLKRFAVVKEHKQGTPVTPTDWMTVQEEDFDNFQGSYDNLYFNPDHYRTTPPPPVATAPAPAPPTIHGVSHVTAFRRGIKRDQSLFPILKDDKDWDDWQRRTRTQATAQCVERVLDSTYQPLSFDDKELFEEQQKYMMAVFTLCLQTDHGKSLLRTYEGTHEAQKLFAELEKQAKSSSSALLAADQLMTYITSAKLGKNTWNGSTTAFVRHWEEQVRLCESYGGPSKQIPLDLKRSLLESAVNGIPDLRQVKLNAAQLATVGGTTTPYDQYRTLLYSACAQYDADQLLRAQSTPAPPPRRTVYMTDVEYQDNDSPPEFGFDTPIGVISAYRSRMSYVQWNKLSADARRTWDLLDDSAKEIILSGSDPTTRPTRSERLGSRGRGGNRPSRPPPSRRTVQVHDSYPDPDMEADPHDVDAPDVASVADDDPEPADDQYLAMATNRSKPPSPAALQHMMSSSQARPGESRPKSTNPRPQSGSARAVNSSRYVNVCDITYTVSKHQRKFGQSLVDRGANGGLAGTDMRVIATSPHKSVHIEGIDGHQVRDVPIVTAGGVLQTTTGEVIGIFHQYAHINKGASIHSCVQMEAYHQDVNDRSLRTPGGMQRILTVDGYIVPLAFRSGLPYLHIRPYTDTEFNVLPHVIMTSDQDWDPTVLDCDHNDTDTPPDGTVPNGPSLHDNFNQHGEYMDRYVVTMADMQDTTLEDLPLPPYLLFRHDQHMAGPAVPDNDVTPVPTQARTVSRADPDYDALRPLFAYQPVEAIKHTWLNSTQFARIPMSTHLKRHFKSPFPAHNVARRNIGDLEFWLFFGSCNFYSKKFIFIYIF